MLAFPNAKINLGLHITEKRPDGYHSLESCFYPVGWTDVLECIESATVRFTASGISIPGDAEQNLCLQAYRAVRRDFHLPAVHFHLHKVIPIGAGLGGGSSDAAAAVKLLNDIFGLQLTEAQQEDYLRPIGSDCAFFVRNQPRYCHDKGDRFEDINVPLKGLFAVLVYPDIAVSTAQAYAGIRPKPPAEPLRRVLARPVAEWRHGLANDFETGIFALHPVLASVKEQLYDLGAVYAAMSGSGSTVFGLFEQEIGVGSVFPDAYSVWSGPL